MCKTYEAIYKVQKHVDTNILIVWIDGAEIKGELHCCGEKDCKCLDDVISLKGVKVKCKKTGEEHHMKWLNIPTAWIQAFCFECCLID